MTALYEWLMAAGREPAVDTFDQHVFACVIASGLAQAERPLTESVGLGGRDLLDLLSRYFPTALWVVGGVALDAEPGDLAIEEEDLRTLLLRHRSQGRAEEDWLAAMVARRSLLGNHLWEDLGLHSRGDLSGLLHRNFQPLAVKNDRDMKWKKFFYRMMCEEEGLRLCKSPICDTCVDIALCFENPPGVPVATA